jgi:flagellar biogenesis protein FliO
VLRLAFALICITAPLAAAEPSPRFEILDRGDAVEIIAFDTTAASTAITPVRSRLEVPLVGRVDIPKLVPAADKTVKVVELDGSSQRVLSVKLAFDHPEVRSLAKLAQAIQVGSDLHLIVPRAVPAPGQTIVLPEPTLPPALAEKAAAIAPVPTIPTPAPAAPITAVSAKPATVPAAAASAKPAASPAPTTTAAAAQPTKPAKPAPAGTAPEASQDNVPILLALTLAALGGAVWLKRRNQAPKEPVSSIEVIAQRSLGGKAKVVWLRAGEREMIVAVSPQSVRTLGHWKKGDAPFDARTRAPLPEAVTHHIPPETSSPAVAGILRLRARTNAPPPSEEPVVDGDPDAAWAKEILAATAGARR